MSWSITFLLGRGAGWVGFMLFCWLVDFVLMPSSVIRPYDFLRAPSDSAAHGLIAMAIWTLSVGRPGNIDDLAWTLACGAVACAIDVDHFVAAGSWRLKDALRLPRRPFMHASTWWLVPLVAVVVSHCVAGKRSLRASVLVSVAIISHHLRDSHRRGLWFPPFGSTAPLPWWLATVAMCALYIPASVLLLPSPAQRVLVTPLVQSV
eukprot:scpid83411/ scgid35740/ Transmembrane protein C5orf28